MPRVRGADVKYWILERIHEAADQDLATQAARQFGIKRQVFARYIRQLINEGTIVAEGQTRARRYRLPMLGRVEREYDLGSELHEDVIWTEDVKPLLSDLPPNILEICEYALTEILNNANDHSDAQKAALVVERTTAFVAISIDDKGIGIFRKIREAHGLEDDRHAILELSKGRLTTDPERHTGEGIFFTSRMVDVFGIFSRELQLFRERETDWLFKDAPESDRAGTYVVMKISTRGKQTMRNVFDQYATEQDDYAFRRTNVVVKLAESEGGSLISRSQAKRIMARLERFREVILDFKGITSIGPAFADEIFRVWNKAHLHVTLFPINMSEGVRKMVRRAAATEPQEG